MHVRTHRPQTHIALTLTLKLMPQQVPHRCGLLKMLKQTSCIFPDTQPSIIYLSEYMWNQTFTHITTYYRNVVIYLSVFILTSDFVTLSSDKKVPYLY